MKNSTSGLILLDAELQSLHMQNYEQYDVDKGFLNGPFFTMFRKKAIPMYRTNPSYKQVLYRVPISKPNGIVFEEYIGEGPMSYSLIYEFKFITVYREFANEMEHQMRYYFRNKRNIIVLNEERFSIGSEDANNLSEMEIVNRDSPDNKTMYVTTYTLKLDCFTRDLSTMQKREAPNAWKLDVIVNNGAIESTVINIDQSNIKLDYPGHPIPE
jgi:hypothetical protein